MVTANREAIQKRYPRLARILELLSQAPDIREELLEEIQDQIRKGEYLTEEKLNVAICRLLREILR